MFLTVQQDLALDAADVDQVVHAVEAAQQRGLAAAARPDEGGNPVAGDVHGDALEGHLVAVIEPEVVHPQADVLVGDTELLRFMPSKSFSPMPWVMVFCWLMVSVPSISGFLMFGSGY
jgi:hypothetical protein